MILSDRPLNGKVFLNTYLLRTEQCPFGGSLAWAGENVLRLFCRRVLQSYIFLFISCHPYWTFLHGNFMRMVIFVRYFVLVVIFCKQTALIFASAYSSAISSLAPVGSRGKFRWRQTQKAFNNNGGLSLNAWIDISVKPRFGGGSRGMVLDIVCWLFHKFSFGIEVEIGLRVERSFPQQSLDVCHA